MTFRPRPPNPPPYFFQEEELFQRDRARLGERERMSDQEIDVHVFAIQDMIMDDPFREPQSHELPQEPAGTRVAVDEPTPFEPNALMIVYRVEGQAIRLWRVRKRDD